MRGPIQIDMAGDILTGKLADLWFAALNLWGATNHAGYDTARRCA